ncbi:MAG: Gfo/Idh/MocA family oxidoreductase [Planctomycetes bacterium]|nr:Gfo/Idh/MocA family oxidoreductase [Planctomycetota bacterium]
MRHPNRREMLKTSAALGAGVWLGTAAKVNATSANEKLNVACIGVGGQGGANVNGVAGENVVAVCDVDEQRAGKNLSRFPGAKQYTDFRKMLDEMDKQIDAVVVSTPDHTHFHPARKAMLMGKHCYCEKPLAHSAWECRELTNIAKKMNVATQLGNQRHAFPGMRRIVEAVRSGMIGEIKDVYSTLWGNRGMPAVPTEFPEVPKTLDWNLWIGPAKMRKYSPEYCPYKWRFWWDFGTAETGNWGCHILDIPFWALKLRHPTRVDLEQEIAPGDIDPQRTPQSMLTRLDFPAEGGRGPVRLHWWYGGGDKMKQIKEKLGVKAGGFTVFVGDKGVIASSFDKHTVEMFDGSTPKAPEETIANSPGFHNEWLTACKGGPRSTCDFVDYSGALAESVLLANTAFRAGGGFDWDATAFKATGNAKADEFIYPDFREGWKV